MKNLAELARDNNLSYTDFAMHCSQISDNEIRAVDSDGRTAIDYAIINRKDNLLTAMLQHMNPKQLITKFNYSKQDPHFDTYMECAAYYGNWKAMQILHEWPPL